MENNDLGQVIHDLRASLHAANMVTVVMQHQALDESMQDFVQQLRGEFKQIQQNVDYLAEHVQSSAE